MSTLWSVPTPPTAMQLHSVAIPLLFPPNIQMTIITNSWILVSSRHRSTLQKWSPLHPCAAEKAAWTFSFCQSRIHFSVVYDLLVLMKLIISGAQKSPPFWAVWCVPMLSVLTFLWIDILLRNRWMWDLYTSGNLFSRINQTCKSLCFFVFFLILWLFSLKIPLGELRFPSYSVFCILFCHQPAVCPLPLHPEISSLIFLFPPGGSSISSILLLLGKKTLLNCIINLWFHYFGITMNDAVALEMHPAWSWFLY